MEYDGDMTPCSHDRGVGCDFEILCILVKGEVYDILLVCICFLKSCKNFIQSKQYFTWGGMLA